jgi:hypothetical protein
MRLGNPSSSRGSDRDPDADARTRGVDRVFYVDMPGWWCSLTAPFALSWKREALFIVCVMAVAFGLGVVVGARVLPR